MDSTTSVQSLPFGLPPAYFSKDPISAILQETNPLDISKAIPPALLSGPAYSSKPVKFFYDSHALVGTLYLLPHTEYLKLFASFFDIPPSTYPHLNDATCEPWVLLHGVQGMTWTDVARLPSQNWMSGVYDAINGADEPSFAAVTSDAVVWDGADNLGHFFIDQACADNDFELRLQHPSGELIIALPSHRPLKGTRIVPKKLINRRMEVKQFVVTDFLPLAASETTLALADKINAASRDPNTNSAHSRPAKKWLRNNTPEILNQSGFLSPQHELWRHRGNEFLFRRDVWCALCYTLASSEETAISRGSERMPLPYYQILFPDLQARARPPETDIGLGFRYT